VTFDAKELARMVYVPVEGRVKKPLPAGTREFRPPPPSSSSTTSPFGPVRKR
jgi:hypothetical protein